MLSYISQVDMTHNLIKVLCRVILRYLLVSRCLEIIFMRTQVMAVLMRLAWALMMIMFWQLLFLELFIVEEN
jgi:hypothetical protein